MRKNGTRVYALVDQHTGYLVVFNLAQAVFEVNPKEGKGTMYVNEMTYAIDTQELMTLLQGSGVEMMHCTRQEPNPEEQQPVTDLEVPVNAE